MNLLQGNSTQFPLQDIPLSCNVCIKRPDFSDVSHLLTHIQSKGHLAAEYKLKVAAGTDPEAQDALADYQQWYNTYGLQELMEERMSQKNKKKANGSSSRRSTPNTVSSRNTPALPNVRRPAGKSRLDPQLNRRGLAPSRSATPLSYFDPSNFGRSLAPIQASWGHGSYLSNSPSTIKQESVSSFDDEDGDYDDGDYPPKSRRVLRQRAHNSVSAASYADDASTYGSDDLEIKDAMDKLKGKYWEGMGLFDSATPDMKRKRNQKKNASVLRGLQTTSENIDPIEFIHDAAILIQKTRDIDGLPPSEDDLIEGETEPEPDHQEKKRPQRRPRQPLIKKEPNTGRVTRGSKISAPLYTRTHRGPYYDGGDDEDDDLTYQARPVNRRAGLSIHRDNTGPEITFTQPAPMNYLTSGYPLRGNGHNLVQRQQMYEHPVTSRPHARQHSWNQNMAFRPSSHGGHQQTYPILNMFGQHPTTNNDLNHTFGTFGQAFGPSPMTMPPTNTQLFQASAGADLGWSMFGDFAETIPDQVDSVMGDADLELDMGVADGTQSNPHFLSDPRPEIKDDEGTISATSEH